MVRVDPAGGGCRRARHGHPRHQNRADLKRLLDREEHPPPAQAHPHAPGDRERAGGRSTCGHRSTAPRHPGPGGVRDGVPPEGSRTASAIADWKLVLCIFELRDVGENSTSTFFDSSVTAAPFRHTKSTDGFCVRSEGAIWSSNHDAIVWVTPAARTSLERAVAYAQPDASGYTRRRPSRSRSRCGSPPDELAATPAPPRTRGGGSTPPWLTAPFIVASGRVSGIVICPDRSWIVNPLAGPDRGSAGALPQLSLALSDHRGVRAWQVRSPSHGSPPRSSIRPPPCGERRGRPSSRLRTAPSGLRSAPRRSSPTR